MMSFTQANTDTPLFYANPTPNDLTLFVYVLYSLSPYSQSPRVPPVRTSY